MEMLSVKKRLVAIIIAAKTLPNCLEFPNDPSLSKLRTSCLAKDRDNYKRQPHFSWVSHQKNTGRFVHNHQACIISKGPSSCPNTVFSELWYFEYKFHLYPSRLFDIDSEEKLSMVCHSDFWMQIFTFVRNKHEALPNN